MVGGRSIESQLLRARAYWRFGRMVRDVILMRRACFDEEDESGMLTMPKEELKLPAT